MFISRFKFRLKSKIIWRFLPFTEIQNTYIKFQKINLTLNYNKVFSPLNKQFHHKFKFVLHSNLSIVERCGTLFGFHYWQEFSYSEVFCYSRQRIQYGNQTNDLLLRSQWCRYFRPMPRSLAIVEAIVASISISAFIPFCFLAEDILTRLKRTNDMVWNEFRIKCDIDTGMHSR